jgi:DegV family protein with EDD domain
MSKVAIVTDSTADIPLGTLNGYPIFSAPLQVIWDGKILEDGIDIQPKEFYERLGQSKTSPTTSQATPTAFTNLYRKLIEEEYSILSIHISAKLSGTMDSATQARTNFPDAKIELIDSESTSMAMGFQVIAAARAAAQGATLQECAAVANQAKAHTGVLFVVNTLEFLRRGGRIGGAAAFLGTALNLKPILELRNGRIEAVERVRTFGKAVDRLLALFDERLDGRRPVHIAGLHANAPEEASLLLERARQMYGASEIFETVLTDVSPVLGTHTGPGCIALAYMAGM